jgi:hypothetical protein
MLNNHIIVFYLCLIATYGSRDINTVHGPVSLSDSVSIIPHIPKTSMGTFVFPKLILFLYPVHLLFQGHASTTGERVSLFTFTDMTFACNACRSAKCGVSGAAKTGKGYQSR